jgi:ABC-type antimicrobial peptide transport system permease subunit
MKLGRGNAPLDMEIVGLVQNAKYSSVKQEARPVYFQPYRQNQASGSMNFYVRSAQDTAELTSMIRTVLARMDPSLPIDYAMTFARKVAESVAIDRLLTILSSALALLATLIAAIGLYGILAYTVAQRTREIGVRMAVGARPGQIRTMILGQVAKMTIVGSVIGIAAALGVGRLVQSLLFETSGGDPMTILAATLLLTLVVLAAGFAPAYRASKVHPMEALRYE